MGEVTRDVRSRLGITDEQGRPIVEDRGRPIVEDRSRSARDPQGTVGLLRELTDETRELFRQEVALARAETGEKISTLGSKMAQIGIGAGILLAAVFILAEAVNRGLTALLAQWLALDVAVWLAPLILAVILGAVGWAMVQAGRRRIREMHFVPEKTRDSLRDNKGWLQEKLSHG